MLQFYWSVLLGVPAALWDATVRFVTILCSLAVLAAFLNPELARWLSKTAAAEWTFPRWWAGIVLVFLLLVGLMRSNYERHDSTRRQLDSTSNENVALIQKIESLTKPIFTAKIESINWHPIPEKLNADEGTAILSIVKIVNVGAESAIHNYQLTAFVGGKAKIGELQMIPQTLTLEGDAGKSTFYGKDALYNKTSTIPHNAWIVGTIWAWFSGIPVDSIDVETVRLTFQDVYGTTYEAVPDSMIGGTVIKHSPGLSTSR